MVLTYNQENTESNDDTLDKITSLLNLQQNDPDVIFVCQQEAKGNFLGQQLVNHNSVPNYTYLQESENFMRGITGGKTNWQGSTVLIKSEHNGSITANKLTKVSVDMMEGKGGVWSQFSGPDFNVALGCAHFNSKDAESRESNARKMIKGIAGKVKSKDYQEKIQGLTNELLQGENDNKNGDQISAYFLSGDLNYRTAPVDSINNRHQLISTYIQEGGYKSLFENDTLNLNSVLVGENGFEFTCNDPFDGIGKGYGPTYKRQQVEACQTYANQHDLESACQCFYGGSVEEQCPENGQWGEKDLKKGDLQLGWLDRVCYKTADDIDGTTVTVQKTVDEACETCYESDHIPVVQQYTITPTAAQRNIMRQHKQIEQEEQQPNHKSIKITIDLD